MSIIAYLELSSIDPHQLPDHRAEPSDYFDSDQNFVISRTKDGNILSKYGENIWNLKTYDAKGRCVYNFSSWHSGEDTSIAREITEEMKKIQISRLFLYHKPRRPISITLIELRKFAKLALKNRLTLSELFEERNMRKILLPSYSHLSAKQMFLTLGLIKELYYIRAKHAQLTLGPASFETISLMQAMYDKHPKAQRDAPQQTKLIPSRLYATLLILLHSELTDFNTKSDAIIELYARRIEDPMYGSPLRRARKHKAISWQDASSALDLDAFFSNKSISNWKALSSYIGEIQCAALYWVHLFSGMRHNEARHLPADSLTTISAGGTAISILRGYTSKIGSQIHTDTFWVTSKIIQIGINSALKIGELCAKLFKYDRTKINSYPLFPALKKVQQITRAYDGAPVISPACHARTLKRLLARWPDMLVRESDIRELEQFDGFRDWRNDSDVLLAEPWPLATHQCRRSLAVYCARSKLVSVGSLAVQFKQFTEMMASYYRRGSAFAVNFIKTDDSLQLMDELETERQMAQFLDYDADIINSNNLLWGGEGNRIQVARNKGRPLIITTDRAVTEQKFRTGLMVYKPGPLGHCTNIEPCDKISFTNILRACAGCEKSILDDHSLRKIKTGITTLKRGQKMYESGSPQYIQLQNEIDATYESVKGYGLLKKMEDL